MRSSPPWGVPPMPLSPEDQRYLDAWVVYANACPGPYRHDTFILAVAAELDRLGKIETAAREYVKAADALLDVTVASTPNTRLSSVAKQIGALNRAWKEYRDADT